MEKDNNVLTDREKEEYQKLKGLEKFGKLVGKELSEENKEKLENYRKRLGEGLDEIFENNGKSLLELNDFRKRWEENIEFLGDGNKEKIIQATREIPIQVEAKNDGDRLIKFELGNKIYNILYPKLEKHTDSKYSHHWKINSNRILKLDEDYVELGGMIGDDVNMRENQELKKYVQQKQGEGFHIAKIEEIKEILQELGKKADLDNEFEEITMLMYLTGMNGKYWLSMGDAESSGNQNSRSRLHCGKYSRDFFYSDNKSPEDNASLFMITYK